MHAKTTSGITVSELCSAALETTADVLVARGKSTSGPHLQGILQTTHTESLKQGGTCAAANGGTCAKRCQMVRPAWIFSIFANSHSLHASREGQASRPVFQAGHPSTTHVSSEDTRVGQKLVIVYLRCTSPGDATGNAAGERAWPMDRHCSNARHANRVAKNHLLHKGQAERVLSQR